MSWERVLNCLNCLAFLLTGVVVVLTFANVAFPQEPAPKISRDYDGMYAKSVELDRILITHFGKDRLDIADKLPDFLHVYRDKDVIGELSGYGIGISYPRSGKLYRSESFRGRPTVETIAQAARARKELALRSVPFSDPFPVVADGERNAAGLRSSLLPSEFVPYTRTNYSQSLAVVNNREDNRLFKLVQDDTGINFHRENPNRLEPWAVPGGLHGLSGWRSRLFVALPPGGIIKVWRERVPVVNSHPLPKVRWSFPDGTRFADVLENQDGQPFEVRIREKSNGEWHSKVMLLGEAAPSGYTGTDRRCVECHKHAGRNMQYGVSLRGDDGNFSFSPLVEGTFNLDEHWPVKWH